MEAPHLLLELLDDGVQLQMVDDRLRAEFPAGTRTPNRTEAIRSARDRLIDLASRAPADILSGLRRAGIIVIMHGNRILIEGDGDGLTAEHRALIRLHRNQLVDELRRERSEGAMVVGSTWTISSQILEFGPGELDAYQRELVTCPDDPATPEEWAALAHARWVQDVDMTDM